MRLLSGNAYKIVGSPAVYYILSDCTKRGFPDSVTFFGYFSSWKSAHRVASASINGIPFLDIVYPPGVSYEHMNIKLKKQLIRRLKIIEGQVRGLQGMIEKEKYCVEIITQASAVKKALSSFEDIMLRNHLSTHVIEQIKSGRHSQAVLEVLKVYKLSKKD